MKVALFAAIFASAAAMHLGCNQLLKRQDDVYHTRVQNLENSLLLFVCTLKGFVNETGFDTSAFELHRGSLRRELAELRSNIETLSPVKQELTEHLDFARDHFRAMLSSNAYRKLPVGSHQPDETILYEVNELKIGLLTMRDSRGAPDPTVSGYGELLAQFSEKLAELKVRKARLAEASRDVLFALAYVFRDVSNVLRLLARNAPR